MQNIIIRQHLQHYYHTIFLLNSQQTSANSPPVQKELAVVMDASGWLLTISNMYTVAWRHQATTRTNSDLLSEVISGIPQGVISQEL